MLPTIIVLLCFCCLGSSLTCTFQPLVECYTLLWAMITFLISRFSPASESVISEFGLFSLLIVLDFPCQNDHFLGFIYVAYCSGYAL